MLLGGLDTDDTFLYVQQSPAIVWAVRDEFPKARNNFIKKCARKGLFDDILTPYSLRKARDEGVLPTCLAVHHKIPLSGGGTNDESNFVIMLAEEHYEIHKKYNKMLVNIGIGDSVYLPSYGLFDKQISIPEGFRIDFLTSHSKKKSGIRVNNNKYEMKMRNIFIQSCINSRPPR